MSQTRAFLNDDRMVCTQYANNGTTVLKLGGSEMKGVESENMKGLGVRRERSALVCALLVAGVSTIACNTTIINQTSTDADKGDPSTSALTDDGGNYDTEVTNTTNASTGIENTGTIGGTTDAETTGSGGETTGVDKEMTTSGSTGGLSGTAGPTTGMTAECGDGVAERLEECDDGNLEGDDGCENDCTRTEISEVFAGHENTCVLLEGGHIKCWGVNGRGDLGYGHTEHIGDDETPSEVGTVELGGAVSKLAHGFAHSCALLEDATVRCWGQGKYGRLGLGNTAGDTCLNEQQQYRCDEDPVCCVGDNEVPADVNVVDVGGEVIDIAAGAYHTCVVLADGKLRCWGRNYLGQLGLVGETIIGDDEVPADAPTVDVGGVATRVVAGSVHTCVQLNTGDVRCWGYNSYGQLGLGIPDNVVGDDEVPASLPPVDIGGDVLDLTAYGETTCARLVGNTVRCWGYLLPEHLGKQPGDMPPPDVNLGGEAADLSVGGRHVCFLLEDGTAGCWGTTYYGTLGYENDEDIGDEPGEMPPPSIELDGNLLQISTSMNHTCALHEDNRIKCWGYNYQGALGYGHTEAIGDKPGDMPPPDVQLFD